jgi:DNA ligase (NAD+)
MNQSELENLYLRAKVAYYEGNPILSDSEFDALEAKLKGMGSKVINQVGSKRKDFDFNHPSKMLSLAKIQMEEGDNKKKEFLDWYNKRVLSLKLTSPVVLEYTPKYDGNAINCIYPDGVLNSILTRSDSETGKDITNKLGNLVPKQLTLPISPLPSGMYEVRCEVVMPQANFEKINEDKIAKGEQPFANARNFVAGLLGKDEIEFDILKQLKIIPLHLLFNGDHLGISKLTGWERSHVEYKLEEHYDEVINHFTDFRKVIDVGLDGIVISFPAKYRKELGENDHDPEWAIAIKFVPLETITEYEDVEWNISKTGELSPVILLKPVQLDGTIVKRASGYNAGYLIENKIGPGAMLSIAKAGDIIPEVQKVVIPSTLPVELPEDCPICGHPTSFDGIHLMCTNNKCEGKMLKRFGIGAKVLDIKGVGGQSLIPFIGHFDTFLDLFIWVHKNQLNEEEFVPYDFKLGSRSLEIFIKAFTNVKTLTVSQVIQSMGIDNVGNSLSPELAKWYFGVDSNFSGFEKAVVEKMQKPEVKKYIASKIKELSRFIEVEIPTNKNLISGIIPKNEIYVEMTGSPKPNWKTKEDFLNSFVSWKIQVIHTKLSDKKCNYLVTDDYMSRSSKMVEAERRNIKIMTYTDFYNKYKS